MRSTVSMKTFILTLVIFFIGVSSFFYFFLYRPEINKVAKGAREVSILKERKEMAEEEVKKLRGEEDKKLKELIKLREELKMIVNGRERAHGSPRIYAVPPGVSCMDCHLKLAPPH